MKKFIRHTFQKFGYDIVSSKIERIIPEINDNKKKLISSIRPYTMTGIERLWSVVSALEFLNSSKIRGAVVECGVWRGGNVMLTKMICNKTNFQRSFYLYDTFTGMAEPSDIDVSVEGKAAKAQYKKSIRNEYNEWCLASLEDVQQNFREFGLLSKDVFFVEGKVEDTLLVTENLPDEIALLRLDTDWYESTKIELEVLYPRLVSGGILIIDDYGFWKGSRKAVDEYFSNKIILKHRIDNTARLIIKS